MAIDYTEFHNGRPDPLCDCGCPWSLHQVRRFRGQLTEPCSVCADCADFTVTIDTREIDWQRGEME